MPPVNRLPGMSGGPPIPAIDPHFPSLAAGKRVDPDRWHVVFADGSVMEYEHDEDVTILLCNRDVRVCPGQLHQGDRVRVTGGRLARVRTVVPVKGGDR